MLACTFDPALGGRSIDIAIAHQLAQGFNKPGSDVTKNKGSWIRLLAEVDKLKRQMSANVSALPINVECLIDERDFSAKMKRSDMEELCAPLFERVEKTLRRCLAESGLKQEDISEIELIGGSTRIPAVKSLIEQVFGKPPSTTLNQDECVARGAAIMAAMLSPSFKVREFSLTDLQPYAINLNWSGEDVEHGEMEVFPKFHSVPFSKILTFFRKSPFVFAASLNRFKKAYTAYNSGVAAYDHWTPEEAKKLELAIAEKVSWLDANISRVKATLKTKDLPIKAAAFHSEHQAFESSMNPVLNKPKPQPPAPPAEAAQSGKPEDAANGSTIVLPELIRGPQSRLHHAKLIGRASPTYIGWALRIENYC
ncbi:97 kDa heat shock protein-like [Daphnia magna]|uniref:97 kDa heat shock protein-like n=1 Tax=Daphnia magna TaxID=35525 RepID=UPI001E1BB511|nr:97 kDa heat shock protein-like [Daphnia magna]XP_045023998.1 97 kDa heat shock protein-like [Daphnia magna]XP_045023999.1 97 kDa heat shock protein-like [Daphnia magna]XP_045024000.1 97 kDa heat shock protein-like [Daphnia magna]XP_045024001.1 97 kDa heat shock protein-like [Daphnia magna]XP_045024002.1 97 kDa heat shock protein-like [Daphnia magna]